MAPSTDRKHKTSLKLTGIDGDQSSRMHVATSAFRKDHTALWRPKRGDRHLSALNSLSRQAALGGKAEDLLFQTEHHQTGIKIISADILSG